MFASSSVRRPLVPPRLEERGREHSELVKRDGRRLIARRTVTSDSGMPKSLLRSYVQR